MSEQHLSLPGSRSTGLSRRGRQLLALAILAICLLAFVLTLLRVNPFDNRATVRAMFDNAIGMTRTGTPTGVRLAGVEVGTVTHVSRVGQHALLTLSVNPSAEHALRMDATAELRPRTPFEGTAYVDLHAGSADAGPLRGTIPLARTSNYVGLYSALSFATAPTRAQTRQLVHDFGATLRSPAQQGLQDSLRRLPQLTRDLAPGASALAGPHDTELLGTVRGASRTFAAVANQEQSLVPFLQGAQATFAAFNTDAGRSLDSTLQTLPSTLTALRSGGAELTSILNRLDPLASDLHPGLQQLPGTLAATQPLLVAARPALAQATPLVHTLRAALSAGARATPPADALLAALPPSLDVLNGSLIGALLRRTPIGLPAYLALLNTLEGGAGAFENFQTPAQGSVPGQSGSGHYVNFEGRFYKPYPTPLLPCSLFSTVSSSIGATLGQEGLCQP